MANRMRLGNESNPVEPRHGQTNNVVLRIDIPQNLKSDLVAMAERTGKTLKQTCIDALEKHVK